MDIQLYGFQYGLGMSSGFELEEIEETVAVLEVCKSYDNLNLIGKKMKNFYLGCWNCCLG